LWQIRGDGCVTHIPYSDKPAAALKTKVTCSSISDQERMVADLAQCRLPWLAVGLVRCRRVFPSLYALTWILFVLILRHGLCRREPEYYLDPIPVFSTSEMVYRGKFDARDVNMHIQEFAENTFVFSFHVSWSCYRAMLRL
jgi:hypothetical protein